MKARLLREPADVCKIKRTSSNIGFLSCVCYMPEQHSHRNAPCPCGSGKKYKRCCYEKDHSNNNENSEVSNEPILIKDWNDLFGLESETHKLEIDTEAGCGWIVPKDIDEISSDKSSFSNRAYLSTHTFYGKFCMYYTEILQSFGFNVILNSWDTEFVSIGGHTYEKI